MREMLGVCHVCQEAGILNNNKTCVHCVKETDVCQKKS